MNSRLSPTHGLTEQQRAFVLAFVANGGNRQAAARQAGYSDPRTESYRLLNLPHVLRAIQSERERALHGDMACMALHTMAELLTPETPAHVRFQAARWILEASGHTARPNPAALLGNDRPLAEMSSEELQELAKMGREALNSLAFPE